ncbi:hypothetical protein E2562_023465 [Oryza meyeriana var. granulata]|uniref:Protein kinase domain-containing protein n=1 Tax=Oryza meyeriana var. granulata TaxID=110450 RepID=A0A6G1FBJ2_9ORYZ|nr:hypothetical protein E2562_023465 [Oryza meyeriana var. granulata]
MAKIAAYQLLLYLFLLLSHTSVSISISQSTTHLSNNKFTISLFDDDFNKLSSEMQHLNLSSNSFVGDVPSSAAIAGVPKLKSLLPVTVFSVLAGVAFISAVAISWLLIVRHQKRRRDLTVWKMTAFCTLDFSECDVLSNLHEENVIGSGGSGKVYRIHVGGKGNAGKVVAVKQLWKMGNSDAKTDKVSVMKLPVYYRAHGEQQPRDRCLHNVNMANHPKFCGWSRVGCICCTAVILFAFYLMALMQLPNLRVQFSIVLQKNLADNFNL